MNPVDALLTGAQAARAIGVSRGLINQWRIRGHLEQQPDGRYKYGDVLRADLKVSKSGKSYRGPRLAAAA